MARAFVNARILTMDRPEHASAILFDDRVLHVGDDETIRAKAADVAAEVEDLGGRVVLPGFVDAHMHLLHVGIKRTRPDLRGTKSKKEALQRVADWLAQDAGQGPVTGEGWDEADWGDDGPIVRADFEHLTHRPLVLRRICGHKAVANGAALPLVRAKWDDERVDEQSGVLLEEPSLYLNEVMPASDDALDLAVQEACRVAAHLGVTTVSTYEQAPLRAALVRAAKHLPIRIHCNVYPQALDQVLEEGFRTGRPTGGSNGQARLHDGGLKVFLDGSLGGHTALMLEPYDDRPDTKGRQIWSDEELDHLFQQATDHDVQLHVHAIGDGAVEQGLRAFERLRDRVGGVPAIQLPDGTTLHHRFEHYEIVHDEQIDRTAALRVWASSQPNFVGAWSSHGGMYEERIGQRFFLNNRFQTMMAKGVRVAFGSDGMPFGPLTGIAAAVAHPVEAERMSPEQAIWHATSEAAASLGRDDIGRLVPGCHADLLVLDRTDVDGDPKEWVIAQTLVGGDVVTRNDSPTPDDDCVA